MVSSVRMVSLVRMVSYVGHSRTKVIMAIVRLGLNVSSSAHNCGCVVDGGNTMAAI